MSEAGPSTVKKARKIDRAKSSKSSGARGVKKTRNADELVELEQALAGYVRPCVRLWAAQQVGRGTDVGSADRRLSCLQVPPAELATFEELPVSDKTKRGTSSLTSPPRPSLPTLVPVGPAHALELCPELCPDRSCPLIRFL